MTVTNRDATRADLPAVDRVFRTSFCDTFAHLYAREDLDAFLAKFTPEAWREEFDDPAFAFRVAEVNGKSAGYVKLGPLTVPVDRSPAAIELRQLYLLKQHHGAGIAEQLMEWALAEAQRRGAHAVFLSVYVDNGRARRFYERYGFEEAGRYHFMVGNHADDEIIMRKML